MNATETTLEALVNGAGIRATIKEDWNDLAPDWAHNGARHYRVTLRYQGRSMRLWWYQGVGIKSEPTVAGIVENLVADSLSEFDSVDDFISEYGLPIRNLADVRNHEKTYKHLKRQNKSFRRLIGNAELIARLQEVA